VNFNKSPAFNLWSVSLATLLLVACNNGTELIQEITTASVVNNLSITGEFCVPPVPPQQQRDIKFIMLYDASQSMFNNDPIFLDPLGAPTNQRLEATKVLDGKIVNACNSGIPNLFESFVIFGSQTTQLTSPDFVQCGLPASVYPAFLAQGGGATNFADAVIYLKTLIQNDIDTYINAGTAGTRRVTYYLVLASDGRPDDGQVGTAVQETNAYILAKWKEVVNLAKLYSWVNLVADTYLFRGLDLSAGTAVSIANLNLQRDLLTGFNLEVPGSYHEIATTALQQQTFAFNFPNVYSLFAPLQM
jgi:hypothetical protein